MVQLIRKEAYAFLKRRAANAKPTRDSPRREAVAPPSGTEVDAENVKFCEALFPEITYVPYVSSYPVMLAIPEP